MAAGGGARACTRMCSNWRHDAEHGRLGGSEGRWSQPLIGAARQTTVLALDGLISWFDGEPLGIWSPDIGKSQALL